MIQQMSDAEIGVMLNVLETQLEQITKMEKEMLLFQEKVLSKVSLFVALADQAATTIKPTENIEKGKTG